MDIILRSETQRVLCDVREVAEPMCPSRCRLVVRTPTVEIHRNSRNVQTVPSTVTVVNIGGNVQSDESSVCRHISIQKYWRCTLCCVSCTHTCRIGSWAIHPGVGRPAGHIWVQNMIGSATLLILSSWCIQHYWQQWILEDSSSSPAI